MRVSIETEKQDPITGIRLLVIRARDHFSGRRALIVSAALVLAVGLIAGWPWLAAAGVAPILLALAPCATMCALGLCMKKMGGKSCSTESSTYTGPAADRRANAER